MTGFLLDTNVISEVRKGKKCDPQVAAWASSIPLLQMFVSVISLMEISSGILNVQKNQPAFGMKLQAWYQNELKPGFEGRILRVDVGIGEECARLNHLRTLPYRDGLIAATASGQGLTLATRNLKDFAGLGVKMMNPWKPV
jgi:predicted nucleic acid-binding protein